MVYKPDNVVPRLFLDMKRLLHAQSLNRGLSAHFGLFPFLLLCVCEYFPACVSHGVADCPVSNITVMTYLVSRMQPSPLSSPFHALCEARTHTYARLFSCAVSFIPLISNH